MKYLKYVFFINFLLVFNCKNPKAEIENEIDEVLKQYNIQA